MARMNATLEYIMNMVTQMTNGMHGGDGMAGGEMHGDSTHGISDDTHGSDNMHGDDMQGGMNMHGGSMNMHDMNMNMHGGMNNGMTGMNGQMMMMMMDPMPDSFFFSKRTKDLVFRGWSVASDNQFILTLLAIFLVAILMEAGRRLTREMHQSITKSTKRSRFSWLYPETSAPSSDTNGRSQNPTHLEDNNMNCSKTESIPVTEEGKETKPNQDGVLESSSPDTPCPGDDEHMQLMNEEHQDGSLKRNTSFELGANRWDTAASPADEYHHCEEAHKVTVSKKRREFLKRLMKHSFVTVSHTSQLVIGYILMLVVMSYNVWLLIAVVTGATIGYLLFSWDRIKVVETGENLVSHDHSRVPTSTVV